MIIHLFNAWNLWLCWLIHLRISVSMVCPFCLASRKKEISFLLCQTEFILVQTDRSQMDHLLTLDEPRVFDLGENT